MWPRGEEHSWALPDLPADLNKHHAHCTGILLSARVARKILFSKDNSSVKSHFPWLAPFSIMSEKMRFDWKGMPENKTNTVPLSKALNPLLFQKHQVIIFFNTHEHTQICTCQMSRTGKDRCHTTGYAIWHVYRVISASTFPFIPA